LVFMGQAGEIETGRFWWHAQIMRDNSTVYNCLLRPVLRLNSYLIRNRNNRPDEWEHSVFVQQFKKADYVKGKPYSQTVGQTYRYMIPEYYGTTCLQCHGEPKGEKDISGGLKEGAKLGDLGGAVSLTIPKK
ncbi:DUF3365 domain-containing protein, partial [Massilia sp. CCM 8695]